MLSRGVGRVAARVVSETLSTPPPPPLLSCAAPAASAPSSTTTPDAGRIHSNIPPARLHHQASRYSQASRPDPSSHAEPSHPPPPPPPPPPRRTPRKLIALTLLLTTSGTAYYLLSPDALPTDRVLNTERFTPFDLIARETVSPTSFILTLRPSPTTFSSLSPADIATQLADPWVRHDLWAVEVKQPQLQIARDYTPLPPSPDQDPATIRLWIRAVDGGETSTYLSRLPVGSRVELRGPRGSFDLSSRLGVDRAPAPPSPPPSPKRRKWDKARNREVIFLAGGTGIATALQAAHSLLETAPGSPPSPATRVRILWAVRSQSDILDLKARHGDRLSAHFVVDDEGSYISAATVLAALGGPAAAAAATGTDERQCVFHSQALHARMSDGAPNAGRRDLARREDCGCPGEGRPGKDLALVSGPDGFIAAYAGAKQWEAGGQVQGAVGGVLGELERRHPGLLKDWIVLKL
ncbi:hypothetical protein B0T11DRAFT_339731 [Plectosphaerella cucumerina]|uniref:FAD-binding FR-type domain-containing protein n=1 Tax=Plectosphaerella cucumerina TaxID=40658 RepID=A0A8K0TFK9_9PEZI|nr:hypothetical protein B0T11DRAFT_339731 [Plectosphaerella cucumerina]